MKSQFECRIARCGQLFGIGLLLGTTIAATSIAQAPPTAKPSNPTQQVSAQAADEAPPPVIPAALLSPAQRAPVPPLVSYRNGQLTIIAENCNLGDILEEVHRLTGVQIDLPASASSERMAARLGPGLMREVLTSLLSSTDFNYIMQAADDDPDAVQSLLLMPRSKENSKPATNSPSWAQRRNARPPEPVADAGDTSSSPEAPAPAAAASASETPVSAPADAQGTGPSDAPMQADAGTTPGAATTDVSQQSVSPSDQVMQGLRRLYEQRRQMQEQQNQRPAGSGTPQ